MFGYIKPFKPELKVKEYQSYNAVYCGFCKAMGNSGALLRMTLSYDFTFFCLLSLSLKSDFCGFDVCRCPVKLFSKKPCVKQSKALDYAADLAVLMLHGKILDNIYDKEHPISSRLLMLYLKPKYKKIAKRLPDEAKAVLDYISLQEKVQNENSSIDASCHPTATLLSSFFKRLSEDSEQSSYLERLGYVLGRWIYLLDALDDLEVDTKKGNFNPLKDENREEIICSLNVCISEAADSLQKLRLYHFKPILENIIFLGLDNTQKAVLNYKNKKERKRALNGKSL